MVSFDTIAFSVFVVILTVFLLVNKKHLQTVRLIPGVLYFSMYRTKLGLNLMTRWALQFKWLLRHIAHSIVAIGFIGMVFVTIEIIRTFVQTLIAPETTPGITLVLPIEAKGVFHVPFFFWIISLMVVVIVHEFCHGLFARLVKVRVVSSGFAFMSIFLPIIPAAFVEPDEKQLRKKHPVQQLAVFAAGPVSNIFFGLLLLGLFIVAGSRLIDPLFNYEGVEIAGFSTDTSFNIHQSGMSLGEAITFVGLTPTKRVDEFRSALDAKKPGESVSITTDKKNYDIVLGPHPADSSKSYLGVMVKQKKSLVADTYGVQAIIWFYDLIKWILALSLGVGLFNLLPLGIVDGGRMFQLVLDMYVPKWSNKIYHGVSGFLLSLIIIGFALNFVR